MSTRPFALRHAWNGPANRAALEVLRSALAGGGVALEDAPGPGPAHAAKMHGMELREAAPGLLDLADVAAEQRWSERLPGFVQEPMHDGERWLGIPLGIHRANLAWVHGAYWPADRPPGDFDGFVGWLDATSPVVAHPLAVGAEPWQVGALFESVVVAVAGADIHRDAFVARRADVVAGPAFGSAVEALLRLRPYVDDDALTLDWSSQRARVAQGKAAVQVMGDWAGVGAESSVRSLTVPGTDGTFVWIADFLAPFSTADRDLIRAVAACTTGADFQRRFARAKNCRPAFDDAGRGEPPWRAQACPVAPVASFTFDQCCPVEIKKRALAILADGFLARRDSGWISRRVAEALEAN